MDNKFKKVILVILISPLLLIWILTLLLSELFNELESTLGGFVDKIGKAGAEKLNIEK